MGWPFAKAGERTAMWPVGAEDASPPPQPDSAMQTTTAPMHRRTFGMYADRMPGRMVHLGYGKWVHIDGWSEAIIEYIRAYEQMD